MFQSCTRGEKNKNNLVLLNMPTLRLFELIASRFWYEPSWLSGFSGAQMNILVQILLSLSCVLAITGKSASGTGSRQLNPAYCHCFLPLFFTSRTQEPTPYLFTKPGSYILLTEKTSQLHYGLQSKIFILIPEALRGKHCTLPLLASTK